MGQGHVARAQPMEAPQHRHGSADAVTTLYPYQTSDYSVSVRVLQLAARRHQPDPFGVTWRESAHDVDLLQGELHGVEELCLAWHVGRPELCPNDPLFQTNQIGLPLRTPAGIAWQVLVEGEVT